MDQKSKHIVRCPFCQTKFYVWLSLLLEKRKVRCSHCENTWFQDPEDCIQIPQEAPEKHLPQEISAPSPKKEDSSRPMRLISNEKPFTEKLDPLPDFNTAEPYESTSFEPSKQKKSPLLSVVAFLLPILAFVLGRDLIVQAVPSLSYIYRAVGLSLQSEQEGFEIRNTAWFETIDKGIPSIVVSGELTNMSSRVKTAPAVRVTIKGTGGCHPMDFASRIFGDDKAIGPDGTCVIDQWTVNASYNRLLPGQVVPFSTAHPYDERSQVTKVKIDFVE